MRVLHLTPELPHWPGGTGGATRQFHLLRRLVERGHEVTVVAPVAPDQREAVAATEAAGIDLRTTRRPDSRVRETVSALARRPSLGPRAASMPVLAWQVGVFWASLMPVAQRALADIRPDVITVDHDNAASWLSDLEHPPPAVLTLHNLGWHYYANRARAASGVSALALHAEARRFRRHDVRAFESYRSLIAVSERDRLDLADLTPTPITVIPNGVATDELRPAGPAPDGATLLFTGTLDHPPNSEGIRWFADQAWPSVRAARPDARLLVVGRNPPRQVSALHGRDGIDVVGPVPSMEPWFERATAVVVPLRSGGGTRLKLLEAMASGRAIASTTIGCEGLDLHAGRELLVEDEPEALAAAAVRLLADEGLRERLATAAREVAEARYDWRSLGDRLAELLEAAAKHRQIPSAPG